MRVGFNATNSKSGQIDEFYKMPIVPTDFTNAIAYGQTGSGKTSGFILPNLNERIKNGFGVIVFDFKDTLTKPILEMAKKASRLDDIKELGVPWGEQINLLRGMSDKEFEIWHKSLDNPNSSRDPYWPNSARSLITALITAITVLQEAAEQPFAKLYGERCHIDSRKRLDFAMLYSFLKPSHIKLLLSDLKQSIDAIRIAKMSDDPYQIAVLDDLEKRGMGALNTLYTFSLLKEDGDSGGNNGVIEVALNDLSALASNMAIGQNGIDIEELIGKIVIIHSESFSDEVLRLVHNRLFDMVKSHNTIGKNRIKTSFFIDEAHKILTAETKPNVSVCREFNIEYLLAVQNENLMIEAMGSLSDFEAIKQNLSYKISFRNEDFMDAENLADFEFIVLNGSKNRDGRRVGKVAEPYFYEKDSKLSAKYFAKIASSDRLIFIDKKSNTELKPVFGAQNTSQKALFSDEYLSIAPHHKERDKYAILISSNGDLKEVKIYKKK